jgi:hypothetical protein
MREKAEVTYWYEAHITKGETPIEFSKIVTSYNIDL